MTQRRVGALSRHPALIVLLAVAVVLVVAAVPIWWVVSTRVLVPHGAPTPMEALGRLETALRSGDRAAVERALGPGSTTYPTMEEGRERYRDWAAAVMDKYSDPDFTLISVTLRKTESDSVMMVDATATIRSEPQRLELTVVSTMSLDTGESLGWFVSA